MKEKEVTFCFIELNAKVSPKLSGEGWFFCAEVSKSSEGLFFQS